MNTKETKFFMEVAEKAKERSYCDIPVGGVLVKDSNIISVGWNGTLPGTYNFCDNNATNVVHACQNLVARAARAGVKTEGATLYITKEPCLPCALLLVQAGVKRVIHSGEPSFALGKMIEAGVEVVKYYDGI